MALKIKWTKDGNVIDAYVRVLAINSRRQAEGNSEFGVGGVSNPIASDGTLSTKNFHYDVSYGIYETLTSKTALSRGNLVAPYSLNSTINIFTYVYGQLKLKVPKFKDAIDI